MMSRLTSVSTLLCDADGTLFASEQPAFAASAVVTQALAARFGLSGDFTAERLRRTSTGRTFRSTAAAILADAGVRLEDRELEYWVAQEKEAVTGHLGSVLQPDREVSQALASLSRRFALAAVSSSALTRLDACFGAADLTGLFPPEARFSAEDSMGRPASKPDPAIYRFALDRLGLAPGRALAIEDSPTGAASAISAGIRTIGLVHFAVPDERQESIRQLREAGVSDVARTWAELAAFLQHEALAPASTGP